MGEISLVEDDHARRARVVTKTPVRLLALGRDDFDHLCGEVPEFAAAVRRLADERLMQLRSGSG